MLNSIVHTPVLKINVQYSLNNIEKIGLFELTILSICKEYYKNDITFKDYFIEVMKVNIPTLFIEDALNFLVKNKILIIKSNGNSLMTLAIKKFETKINLENIFHDKALYSKVQDRRINLYYDCIEQEFIVNNSDFVSNSFEIIDGKNFENIHLTNSEIENEIEKKEKESVFNKDGVKLKIKVLNNKREVLYIKKDIKFSFEHQEQNIFSLIFDKNNKFLEPYKNKFIIGLAKKRSLLLEQKNGTYNILENNEKKYNLILTDIENIEKQVYSRIYIIFSNDNSPVIKIDTKRVKILISEKYQWEKNSYISEDNIIHTTKNITVDDEALEIDATYYDTNLSRNFNFNLITEKTIEHIIKECFQNIKLKEFYEDIELIQYLKDFNNTEYIVDKIIEKLIEVDIYLFVNKLVSVYENINDDVKKLLKSKIYSKYLTKQKYSFDKLNSIFEKWKFPNNDIKDIQKDILDCFKNENTTTKPVDRIKKVVNINKNNTITKPINNNIEANITLGDLASNITEFITNINEIQRNYNKEEIFKYTRNVESNSTAFGKVCKKKHDFAFFTSVLYQTLFERTQKNNKKLELLPVEFRRKHTFVKLIDEVRHIYAHDTTHQEWNSKMTKSEVFESLKGNKIPPMDNEYEIMQINELKMLKKYLEELREFLIKKYTDN